MLIIKSDLLKLSLNNFSKILFTVLIDLDFSLALKFKKINSYFFKILFKDLLILLAHCYQILVQFLTFGHIILIFLGSTPIMLFPTSIE